MEKIIYKRIAFSGHALRRMFERSISKDEVVKAISFGETIAEYPDDEPYPSRLLLGFIDKRPIHVVVAAEPGKETCYVVTAYDPDPALWDEKFSNKRS